MRNDMSPQLKEYLLRNVEYVENEEFDKLISPELIENGLIDELLDVLYELGGSISPEVVTKQLVDFYAKHKLRISESKKEALETKFIYLANKHQVALYKSLILEQQ